jgi:phosphoserine phosphatase
MSRPSTVLSPRIPVCVVRHGVTPWNREGRIQGWTDIALSDLGRAQAERLSTALAGHRFARVITSTLGRARETAEIVARPHRLPVECYPELREYNCGNWEGHVYQEIREGEAEAFLAWFENPEVPMPGGESMVVAGCRAAPLIDRILGEMIDADGALLIVGHGGIDRLIAAHLLGFNLDAVRRMQLDNASISWFKPFLGRYTLCLWNSVVHLDGLLDPEADPSAAGIG